MGEVTMFRVGIGDLEFRVDPDRHVDSGDHGQTIWVFVGPDQVLRFDCFEEKPHYHYVPIGERHTIDRVLNGDPVEWVFNLIEESLAVMLKHAGFLEAAEALDPYEVLGQVRRVVGEIERFLKAEEEPTST